MLNENLLPLLVTLVCLVTVNGFPVKRDVSGQTSSISINDAISKIIVPPYRMAYTTLNGDIVQPLLVAGEESDPGTIEHLVESLLQAAKKVRNLLHRATKASEQVRAAIDEQVTQLVLVVSIREEQVRRSQAAVTQATNNVYYAQQQVNVAESAARNAEHSLNVANHEIHEAEKDVERARRCGLGRRKKRFLGNILNAINPIKLIEQAVVRPVCSIVNSGGIGRAKDKRSMAYQTFDDSRNRFHNHLQTFHNVRSELSTAQAHLAAAYQALQTIQSILNELRVKQSLVSSLTTKIKNVEVHLNTVLGRSNVLVADTAKLIDFELVIQPLNGIYEEMINNKIMESSEFEITAETARQINANLQKLTKKMAKMPLNTLTGANSEEVLDDSTAPSETDSAEAPGFDFGFDVTGASEIGSAEASDDNTNSGEAHGDGSVSEVTDAPVVISIEVSDDNSDDKEAIEPSTTESDDVLDYDY